MDMTHKQYANSLRQIADFFAAHEELPLPHDADEYKYFALDTREEMGILARALGGHSEKEFDDNFFRLTHVFGGIKFIALATRKGVCRPVVIGKKTVTKRVPTAYEEVEEEVDVIRWECDEPIIADASA